jgi:hypothetical protein
LSLGELRPFLKLVKDHVPEGLITILICYLSLLEDHLYGVFGTKLCDFLPHRVFVILKLSAYIFWCYFNLSVGSFDIVVYMS